MLHFRLTLSGSQREALYRHLGLARQGGDHRKVGRILAMLALAEGLTPEAVAELFKISVQTLRNGVQRLLSEGIVGLLRFNQSPGRPAKLTRAQRRRLIDAGPAAAGLVGNCWRTPMIQHLIEQRFGVFYSVHYLSQLLKNLGFSYHKARFVSDHLDEDKRREWLTQRWPAIVALAQEQNAYVLLGDEASFPQWGTLSYTGARRGQQPTVKTSGQRKGYKVFGLIDYFTGRFFYQCHEGRLNSESYAAFLHQVLSQTRKRILLIQDRACYHTSAAMEAFFEQHKDPLTVLPLPSYSPAYNPIEKLWKKIKEWGTHLHYFPTFQALKDKVQQALLQFKHAPSEVLSLFVQLKELNAPA
jgi:transposase